MDVPEIDVDELERRRRQGAPLIDVRQPDEYEEFPVPGAVLIPLAEVPERLEEIPTDQPLLVICRSGGRSLKAAEFLATQGYEAVNVAGGSLAWADAGKPVDTGAGA
ncbi:rhodanese-like domain-containing protein [soil metagenome]